MDKEPSVYTALLTLPDPTLQPERILWLHVMCQAVIDASSVDPEIKADIEGWVDTEDFENVCGMAGLDNLQLSYAINSLLKDKNRKRAFKHAMEFRFLVRSFIDYHTQPSDK